MSAIARFVTMRHADGSNLHSNPCAETPFRNDQGPEGPISDPRCRPRTGHFGASSSRRPPSRPLHPNVEVMPTLAPQGRRGTRTIALLPSAAWGSWPAMGGSRPRPGGGRGPRLALGGLRGAPGCRGAVASPARRVVRGRGSAWRPRRRLACWGCRGARLRRRSPPLPPGACCVRGELGRPSL